MRAASGRTAPFNGSVTRHDIRAIHREFMRGAEGLYSDDQLSAIEEHLTYLVGAIEDRPIGTIERRRRSIAMANVHARRRAGRPPRILGRTQTL